MHRGRNRFERQASGVTPLRGTRNRLVQGSGADGAPSLTAVFATPANIRTTHALDLSFLHVVPQLQEPFAAAFLEWGLGSRTATRIAKAGNLKRGFIRFLRETGNTKVALKDLTNSLFDGFCAWLQDQRKKDGKPLHPGTCADRLEAVSVLVDTLRGMPAWRRHIRPDLDIKCPWDVRNTATAPLSEETLFKFIDACADEIEETIERILDGWESLAIARERVQSRTDGYDNYADLGICLAHLESIFSRRTINAGELKDNHRDLFRATQKKHPGVIYLSAYFYPSPRLLVPFVLFLSFVLGVNAGSVRACSVDDFTLTDDIPGTERLVWKIWKERAKRFQDGSIAIDYDDVLHPVYLYQFLVDWTNSARQLVRPELAQHLFIFVNAVANHNISVWSSGFSISDANWRPNYLAFLKDHDLELMTPRQIRTTALDVVHAVADGDLRAVQAWARHRKSLTTETSYTTSRAKERDSARLADIMVVRTRWRETNGKIDSRGLPEDADIGAATPGWACLDPYAGIHGPKDKLCSAYGQCPACRLGTVDFRSAYSCAQAYNLSEAISRAAEVMTPQAWLKRLAPVQRKLIRYWLPRFPEGVRKRAERMSLPPLPLPE